MAEDKFSQRRESRFWRSARNQKASSINIPEAIARIGGGGAAEDRRTPARVKILVRKEDLKQVLEAFRDGRRTVRGATSPAAAPPFEERLLNLMRRRQIQRAASQGKGRGRLGVWKPVLHSIPEEV